MKFREIVWVRSRKEMENWPEGKFLVAAVNYRTFAISRGDIMLSSSLLEADALLPDGADIVKACKWLKLPDAPEEKIDGADVVYFELERLKKERGKHRLLPRQHARSGRRHQGHAGTGASLAPFHFLLPHLQAFLHQE